MFNKKTVRDTDLQNKRVLMRADYNVPVKHGLITDDYRIRQSVPTIRYILEQPGTKLVIVSHLGRPQGPQDVEADMEPVAIALAELLGQEVRFVNECVGEQVRKAVDSLEPGGVLMLQNVRYHPEEENNDPGFAKQLAEDTKAEIFVQDGFGVVHRAHATTSAITKLLPSVSGLLLEKEVQTITKVMHEPAKPVVAVVGGAKISDKINILNRLFEIADCVAVGGAMANNFLMAEGVAVGRSMTEPEVLQTAREILQKARSIEAERNFNFLVPVDVVVSKSIGGTTPTRVVDIASHALADIAAYPKRPPAESHSIASDEMILDIGPISAGYIGGAIKMAKTVIWNGTCGVTETKGIAGAENPFSHGTKMIVEAMIGPSRQHQNRPFSLIGGGDTVGYVVEEGLVDEFGHVSTGGGASLDLMGGKRLPGVDALLDKQTAP